MTGLRLSTEQATDRLRRQKSRFSVGVHQRAEQRDVRPASGQQLSARDGRKDRMCASVGVLALADLRGHQPLAKPRDIDVGKLLEFGFDLGVWAAEGKFLSSAEAVGPL
jgi:hypothetical protein